MPVNIAQFDAAREAFRRRAGLNPSNAGAARNVSPKAVSPQGVRSKLIAARGAAGSGGRQNLSQPGREQLKQSKSGEAELIIKALSNRLRNLPPFKPSSQGFQGAV